MLVAESLSATSLVDRVIEGLTVVGKKRGWRTWNVKRGRSVAEPGAHLGRRPPGGQGDQGVRQPVTAVTDKPGPATRAAPPTLPRETPLAHRGLLLVAEAESGEHQLDGRLCFAGSSWRQSGCRADAIAGQATRTAADLVSLRLVPRSPGRI
jgi:hypothetical protein